MTRRRLMLIVEEDSTGEFEEHEIMSWVQKEVEKLQIRERQELEREQLEHRRREHTRALAPVLWRELVRALRACVTEFRQLRPDPEDTVNVTTGNNPERILVIEKTFHPARSVQVELILEALQVRCTFIGIEQSEQVWRIESNPERAYLLGGSDLVEIEQATEFILKPVLFEEISR